MVSQKKSNSCPYIDFPDTKFWYDFGDFDPEKLALQLN